MTLALTGAEPERIFAAVQADPGVTVAQLWVRLDIPLPVVRRIVRRMVAAGWLCRAEPARSRRLYAR